MTPALIASLIAVALATTACIIALNTRWDTKKEEAVNREVSSQTNDLLARILDEYQRLQNTGEKELSKIIRHLAENRRDVKQTAELLANTIGVAQPTMAAQQDQINQLRRQAGEAGRGTQLEAQLNSLTDKVDSYARRGLLIAGNSTSELHKLQVRLGRIEDEKLPHVTAQAQDAQASAARLQNEIQRGRL